MRNKLLNDRPCRSRRNGTEQSRSGAGRQRAIGGTGQVLGQSAVHVAIQGHTHVVAGVVERPVETQQIHARSGGRGGPSHWSATPMKRDQASVRASTL